MKVFYASRFGLTTCSVFLSNMYGFYYFSIQNWQKKLFQKLNLHIRVSAPLAAVSLWRETKKIVSLNDRTGSVTSLRPNPSFSLLATVFSPSFGDFMNEMKFLENKTLKRSPERCFEVKDSCSRIRSNKKHRLIS